MSKETPTFPQLHREPEAQADALAFAFGEDAEASHVRTPLGVLEISRERGSWSVLFEGFSRSRNGSLAAALAEATGARRDSRWILLVTRALDNEMPSQKLDD